MKRNTLVLILIVLYAAIALNAQGLPKPTLKSVAPTPEQSQKISEGVRLHDQKKYDQAIAKFEEVLKESPDCTEAIYEMSFSYGAKGDESKALETAIRGAQYKSDQLAHFYGTIANIWVNQGKSADAIDLYLKTIKLLENDKGGDPTLVGIYLNLGVAYTNQKQFEKARTALKKSIDLDQFRPTPNYYLAEVFFGTKYRVPALLAAARLVSLEQFSPRAKRAAFIINDVVTGGAKKAENSDTINIFVSVDEPTDEGDFGGLSMIMGLLGAGTEMAEENKGKSEEEKFVDKVDGFIGFLESDAKKNKSTFVGKTYVPFILEMKRKGYVKTFAYLVLANNGNNAAAKWVLNDNAQKVVEFTNWAKTYEIPK